ncbi:helix-turn-helix domain-containing protein [Streptomyces yangpuensis]|uniref:helix-turn-helix domain-containing protein n=1 Tax=Streptomyces yangpuensis TaxID=1648182 RepID=UPI0006295A16|nr:helix-turn-helix transcriptional regulator [Streptomyces yangpuensis]
MGHHDGRERDVLRLVATGAAHTDIARRLFPGEATVKSHLNRAMAESGLSGSVQVVVFAYEAALVTPSGAAARPPCRTPRRPGGHGRRPVGATSRWRTAMTASAPAAITTPPRRRITS